MKTRAQLRRYIGNPRALGAECDVCPLNGQTPVEPSAPPGEPRFTVLLDGVGEIDDATGSTGEGKTGMFLHKLWRLVNVEREQAAIRSAMLCAPKRNIGNGQLKQAVECCRPRLARELDGRPGRLSPASTQTLQRKLVLVCGDKALQAVSGKSVIDDWRGYPVEALQLLQGGRSPTELSSTIFFPTYDPEFVRRKPQYWHVFRRDVRVAWAYLHDQLQPFRWPTLLTDNDSASEQFLFSLCERLEAGEEIDVGVDVETGGDWTTRLLLVGIATVETSTSLVFPFANEHIEAYVRFILSHPKATLVVQNGNHDQLSLERNGFKLSSRVWDTIVASRVLYPDLPHDLGFLATLFFFIDRWKSEFHAGSSADKKGDESWEKYLQKDPDRFLRYNAKDAASQVLMKRPMERLLRRVL